MNKLTIKMSEWGRATTEDLWQDNEPSLLNTEVNRKCCLGFLGQACGISDAALMDRGMPSKVSIGERACYSQKWPDFLFNLENRAYMTNAKTLALINDDSSTDDEHKIVSITKIFNANGWEVEFVP